MSNALSLMQTLVGMYDESRRQQAPFGSNFRYEIGSRWVHTFLSFYWPPEGGGGLWLNNSHAATRSVKRPSIWFSVPFALEMGWLTRTSTGSYKLGPYLKEQWYTSTKPTPRDLGLSTTTLWKVKDDEELHLSVATNWQFELHEASHLMLSQLLHLYSNVVQSSVVNNTLVNLLAEVDYKRQGGGHAYVEPRRIRYLPVRSPWIDIVETRITDVDGQPPIDVKNGRAVVTLHFTRDMLP